ncbi:glycoside hydrolase family 2 protein [Paenibacillus kandeliae]|uniref:glycoside hydrolase family 2 protein n=1 Tax=Paenibacillus kandeliae TaxID=3231269 RepID=UPI00345787A2
MNTRQALSKDQIDRQSFKAQYTPWDQPISEIQTEQVERRQAQANWQQQAGTIMEAPHLLLDGQWQMAEEGDEQQRLQQVWDDAYVVNVPGSIHQALVDNGVLGDPSFGENADAAKDYSHRTWWHKVDFELDQLEQWQQARLVFEGVSPACDVWLNGQALGYHNGAFGGPEHEVGQLLQASNTLIVRVHPAPLGNEWNIWHSTVVFNCNYGWHYVNLPAVGIWQSVKLEAVNRMEIRHPFVAALSLEQALAGQVDVSFTLTGQVQPGDVVHGVIRPEQGDGQAVLFTWEPQAGEWSSDDEPVHLQLNIPQPQLWWPLDMGEQPLYRIRLAYQYGEREQAATDVNGDVVETTFGIRHIGMLPSPQGTQEELYDWTFAVNGVPVFAKGTGWCTLDALMDFGREHYEHFLQLAADQHVNMMRAWGGGMPETDDFYDLCDRLGIMILQEWPTCWGSHANQPYDALEETVQRNTLRLRNHPSLVMWGGGNETSSELDHESMNMMGRYSVELDGTRPFHRTDPLGGSTHDHIVWNGWTPAYSFDYYAGLDDMLLSEFGLASAPVLESVLRYMPEEERHQWPPEPGRSFYHHLPAFNTRDEMRILSEFAGSFVPCESLEQFVTGTQLAQVVSLRHKMERARCHWPLQTGVVTYKLNDVYPGVSWATIDWYGVPKMSHYFTADSYAPLAVVVLFEKLNSPDVDQALPVYLLDERRQLDLHQEDWTAGVRVYDAQLQLLQSEAWQAGSSPSDTLHSTAQHSNDSSLDTTNQPAVLAAQQVRKLGEISLTSAPLEDAPLLIVSELVQAGEVLYRTFYWLNFDARPGVLLNLPSTTLSLDWEDGTAITVDAVSLSFSALGGHQPVDSTNQAADPINQANRSDQAVGASRYKHQVKVTNTGEFPAVAVELYNDIRSSSQGNAQSNEAASSILLAEDNFFWLDRGESRIIHVASPQSLSVRAWNVK